MLQVLTGLGPVGLRALADLERQVLAVDGGRLKLEWETLRTRPADRADDLVWIEDGTLLGYFGLYSFGGPGAPVELAGAVTPAARCRGIGSALLERALALCADRGARQVLLVVPRGSAGGGALASRHGGELVSSEHALVLTEPPPDGPEDPGLVLRPAGAADAPAVARLLEQGFGYGVAGPADELVGSGTLVAELDGQAVATVRRDLEGDTGGVFGFVVAEQLRGRGIGRDVLRRVCRQLRADGARRVGLEVAVHADRALALYTSLGFVLVATEDYRSLPAA